MRGERWSMTGRIDLVREARKSRAILAEFTEPRLSVLRWDGRKWIARAEEEIRNLDWSRCLP